MKYNSKVDRNQPEIVKALRDYGAVVIHTHSLKNAFDILVGFNGTLYAMEIKDGNKPKSARKLTTGELKCKDSLNSVGVNYYIVTTTEDAIKIIQEQK